MGKIEPPKQENRQGLTEEIRDFWTRNVNAERLLGEKVSSQERGSEAYFAELEAQRFRSHRHLPEWIRSMQPGRSVLEVGSGVGLDTYVMARHGLNVTAIDLTTVAVAQVKQRFERNGLDGRFAVADGCRLPFSDDSFDYVYSFGVLHHAADTAAAIREAHRVLQPGGEARIMLYHRRSLNELVHRLTGIPFEERDELCPVVRRFTLDEVREMFKDFRQTDMTLSHAFGEGYGAFYRWTPRPFYTFLSRHFGWHIMIAATK